MNKEDIIYTLNFSEQAQEDIKALKESDIPAYKKVTRLLEELIEHPTTGIGKPELLKHNLSGLYSRRITQKHRLIYQVDNETISVLIISAKGHYKDK